MKGAFLAVDWGTTHLRAWRVGEDGAVGASRTLDLGVSRLQPGEAATRFRTEVRPALGAERLPALIAGMAGSTLGWREVPYADCPLDAAGLAGRVLAIEGEGPFVGIAPGVRGPGVAGPDVMRGEEVQVFGWIAAEPAHAKGAHIVCHPGTHAKWVLVEDGRMVRFVTAMTGELFALLSTYSVLKGADGPADGPAFEEGVAAAGKGEALAARLFSARSRVVGGGGLKPQDVPAYLSGLLIGADVAATPALLRAPAGAPVTVVGDAALVALYRRALQAHGVGSQAYDGERAALDGLRALFAALPEV